MQQVATQQMTGNMMDVIKAVRAAGTSSVFSTGNTSSDPFLQIIQNMIAAMQENGAGTMGQGSLLEGLFAQTGQEGQAEQNTGWDVDQLDQDPLMQAMASMFFAAQPTQWADFFGTQTNPLTNAQGNVSFDASQNVLGLTNQQMAALTQMAAKMSQQSQQEGKNLPQMEIVSTLQSQGEESQQQIFSVQNQFKNAIDEARKQLAAQQTLSGTSDVEELEMDADKLQSQVSVFKASEKSGVFQMKEALDAQSSEKAPLLDQVKQGIDSNLKLGKNEFTIKLKPESLGEITVKLVEKAGKMTLSIATANAQTARLINADLAALREAVRPMQVEVREAVPEVQENNQGQFQQFDMMGQQMGQRQAFQYQQETPAYYADLSGDQTDVETHQEQVLETELDTYI